MYGSKKVNMLKWFKEVIPMNDRRIIEGLKKGYEETFEECYYQYKNLVYYVIIKITKDKELAEELVQDTFIKMYQQINKFDGKYFKAWLLTIAKNLALNEIKRQKKEIEFGDYLVVDVLDTKNEMRNLLYDLEHILNPKEYDIFILRIVYDMKQREIAEYLNIPIGTVGWTYQEALKKVKKNYRKEDSNENKEKNN